ncbi:MAG: DMT family transporter [Candidatus Bathyarchaeia archaeon]
MRKRNWVLFTLMVLIWGSNWVVMKVGLRFVSPLNLVMQRLLLASIALLPVIVWRQKSLPRDRFTWLKLVMLSLINATSMISTNIGLLNEASGLSSLITYTQPLFVFCLAVPFLGEKISATRILGVVSGFLGVAALYAARLRTQINISSPFLFLILGAFFWAITVIYYKKFLNYVDPAIVNMVQFPIGAILLLSIASTLEGLTFSDNMLYILSILYMSVLGSALASTIWLTLMREEETTVVSTSSLIVPAIALIFGLVFLGEVIEQISLLGFALILIGIYLVNKSHK